MHPLVTVSNINPEDIPDVPVNKFLMRGATNNNNGNSKDTKNKDDKKDRRDSRDGNRRRDWDNRNFNRRERMTTKSGRIIKGRGVFVSYKTFFFN